MSLNTRQWLRLLPLSMAIRVADRLGKLPSRMIPPEPLLRWHQGVSVIIPERDSPELLIEALASLKLAALRIEEPHQIVVVANGAPRSRYAQVLASFPDIELVHSEKPLGFSTAIHRGLAVARYDWTFLLNNDVTLDPNALLELLKARVPGAFAIGSQIMQRSASGRREETGFVDWYLEGKTIKVFHATPQPWVQVRPHLCVSGGAGLFRTQILKGYVSEGRCYDPFYWEDVEWGVRAWQDGYRVLFCPGSVAYHQHRMTTARFYSEREIDRIIARNRLWFETRNALLQEDAAAVLKRVRDLPYASQREFARVAHAWSLLRRRYRAQRRRIPGPRLLPFSPQRRVQPKVIEEAFSYRLRAARPPAKPARPIVMVVCPFALYPPKHGGARRVAGLLGELRRDFDIVLVADEASSYDVTSVAHFDELHAIHLVRAEHSRTGFGSTLTERIRAHCHKGLVAAVDEAQRLYHPDIVQVEHLEVAELVHARLPGQRWILGLHDAYADEDFADAKERAWFEDKVISRYDAVTVCSTEDFWLVDHPFVRCVPNGTDVAAHGLAYRRSDSFNLLFMGPFRYAQNLHGVRHFLSTAYPKIRLDVPQAQLLVLGGSTARRVVTEYAEFAQSGVEVMDHREDVAELLRSSALTINPLRGIRGSAIKLIESLAAGRICVSTEEGARGFRSADFTGLLIVPEVAQMADPIVRLLQNPEERHALERPETAKLKPFQWPQCAAIQAGLYRDLLGGAH